MLGRDVADELLDEDRLAYARAAEEANLAALGVGGDEVDDLEARLEDLGVRALVLEGGSLAVDGRALRDDGGAAVDGAAREVEHAAEHFLADGHGDGPARAAGGEAAGQAFRGLHGDAAGDAVAHVQDALGEHRAAVLLAYLDRVEYRRQGPALEPEVEDRSRHAYDCSNAFAHRYSP